MGNVPQLLTIPETEDVTHFNVRHHIFSNTDGFADRCVVRIGRSVRIREDRLAEWIEERTGAKPYQYHWTRTPGWPKGRPRKPKAAGEAS